MASIWSQTCEIKERKSLKKDMETEIVVIGAGITGILTAYQLQKSGKQVIVLEANRIASGQTRNTTAKITSQHGFIYHTLLQNFGKEKALSYAMANENAIQQYKAIIKEEQIDCDFEETSAYSYSNDETLLKQELESALSLHLPASYHTKNQCPIPNVGAIQFERQAQFHPLKFLKVLAESLTIYEHTPVKKVEEHQVFTEHHTISAQKIIFACHYPFINFPGLYFTRMHQERSYVLALKNAPLPDGMFLGNEMPTYSFRSYGDLLLFGGESHRTGHNQNGGRYDNLVQKALELFPDCHEVARWSAQDCITSDRVPFIGQYAKSKPDWYVATGFQKWGMTTALVSATILCDLICGKQNPYADIFRPDRFSVDEVPEIAHESGQALKAFSKQIFQQPIETIKDLPIGHGGILSHNGEKVGVYKDENNQIYTVDVRCPHLGCQLEWNVDERTWDCPCHGSRFDYQGRLLSNPAQEDINLE